MAKKNKAAGAKKWAKKKDERVTEDDAGESPDEMQKSDNEDDLGDFVVNKNRASGEPKSIFAFDSASEESDDEKMLEERLRQFERIQFKETVASDLDDDDEDKDDDDEEEDYDATYRPIKNKYGGDVDERYLEIVEADEGDQPSAAVLEEQEAKAIQKRLANMVSESDVDLELLGIPSSKSNKEDGDENDMDFETVGAEMSSLQLLALVDKKFPELQSLLCRVREELNNLITKWIPLLRLVEKSENSKLVEKLGRSTVMFIKAKHLVSFTYCMNALFYLRLRAQHEAVEGHPVTARLVSHHKLLEQLEKAEHYFMKPGKRLDYLLKAQQHGASLADLIHAAEKHFGAKSSRRAMFNDDMEEENDNEKVVEEESKIESESALDEKRKLTDKMEKTGGVPRPKTKRNPRVANRNRFNKALRRRAASGVREWQPPVNAYGGELTGIHAGLRRSTNLRS